MICKNCNIDIKEHNKQLDLLHSKIKDLKFQVTVLKRLLGEDE